MGIEHVILIITTIAGVLKAYFEMKKAKAESVRAGEAEELLKVAVEGVEKAKEENPEEAQKVARTIKKHTEFLGLDSKFNAIVKEITEGEGNVQEVTKKYNRDRLKNLLEEESGGEDKYL